VTRRISFDCELCGGMLIADALGDIARVEQNHLAVCPALGGSGPIHHQVEDVETGGRL
jgi:hypothetical protein